MLGNRVAVSPIVTVEPRRRKFHKPITLTIPVPQAAARGMINQYSGDTPTLRLLCSITGTSFNHRIIFNNKKMMKKKKLNHNNTKSTKNKESMHTCTCEEEEEEKREKKKVMN